jgi:NADPH2:quinone reductase
LYGGLDPRPTELCRDFGMAWGIGGWLVMGFLQKIGSDRFAELKQRVASELQSTFASAFSHEISLVEVLQLDSVAAFGKRATGRKYLINPNKAL